MDLQSINVGSNTLNGHQNLINAKPANEQAITNLPLDTNANATLTDAAKLIAAFSDALKNAGFKVIPENLKMMEVLFENNMPLNDEMIIKLNQTLKMLCGDMEKAMFFMKNDMRATTQNARTLNSLVNREEMLLPQLLSLADEIDAMPEGDLKQRLIQALTGKTETSDLASKNTSASNITNTPNFNVGTDNQETQNIINNEMRRIAFKSVNMEGKAINIKTVGAELAEVEQNELILEKTSIKPLENGSQETLKATTLVNELKMAITNATPETEMLIAAKIAESVQQAKGQGFITNDKLEQILKETLKFNLTSLKQVDISPKTILTAFEFKNEKAAEDIKKVIQTLDDNSVIKNKSTQTEDLNFKEIITQKFSINLETDTQEKIDQILNEIKQSLVSAKNELSQTETQNVNPKIFETIEHVTNVLDFQNQMKNSLYIQLPFISNGVKETAELFVFKDKRQKGGGKKGSASALLALNLAAFGHIEAYIQKNSKAVNCQFRFTEAFAEPLFQQNITQLNELLATAGYRLESVSFKKLNEPYTIIDKEPLIEDNLYIAGEKGKIFIDVKA